MTESPEDENSVIIRRVVKRVNNAAPLLRCVFYMLLRILHSYPARFAFVIGAVGIASLIICFRKLMRRDAARPCADVKFFTLESKP